MKVLVIGAGGREHALVWKLRQSPRVTKLCCAPGNAGTAAIAENVSIGADDVGGLLEFAQKEKIDFTVVGPEAPLVLGIVDLFIENGLKIFGPQKAAAQIEGSKIFMKEMLDKAKIPTSTYKTFTDRNEALAYIETLNDFPVVIKADGLAAGKGVHIAQGRDDANEFIDSVMDAKIFGASGDRIIIEKFLDGEEASYIVVADGKNYVPMASSQDHKRVGDGDTGPNTGGMGAYSPAPVVTPEVDKKIRRRVIEPLLATMKNEDAPFSGFLYAGLMIADGEPSVLEFNVRMGDPETQPILPRYKGDLLELLEASAAGDVSGIKPEWDDRAAVCIVMASGGYPGSYKTGFVIEGLEDEGLKGEGLDNVTVFHAGTKLDGDKVVTSGGRVLGVTALGATIWEATDLAYIAASKIKWEGSFYRRDIAKRAIRR
ncbi:MAG: phosphoribosylamine--glycine ligase [Nitrospinota bacterium]